MGQVWFSDHVCTLKLVVPVVHQMTIRFGFFPYHRITYKGPPRKEKVVTSFSCFCFPFRRKKGRKMTRKVLVQLCFFLFVFYWQTSFSVGICRIRSDHTRRKVRWWRRLPASESPRLLYSMSFVDVLDMLHLETKLLVIFLPDSVSTSPFGSSTLLMSALPSISSELTRWERMRRDNKYGLLCACFFFLSMIKHLTIIWCGAGFCTADFRICWIKMQQ